MKTGITSTERRRPYAPVRPANTAKLSINAHQSVPALVQYSFIAFIAILPFEPIGLDITGGALSTARLFEPIFLASFYFFFNPFNGKRSFPAFPGALWGFLAYVVVTTTSALLLPPESRVHFSRTFVKLTEMILFIWAASHLLRSKLIATRALLYYGISSVVLAIVSLLGLAGFDTGAAERETVMGMNQNLAGMWMAVPAAILIGFCNNPKWQTARALMSQILERRSVLIGLTLPIVVMLVMTGSRAGMIALAIGCLTYIFSNRKINQRLTAICFAVIAIISIAYFVATNEFILERWDATLSEGNTSGRLNIWTVAMQMFYERPLFGWQPVEAAFEISRRIGRPGKSMDPHNLIVQLLVEVGLLGFIPFFFGLFLCLRAAWKGRCTFGPIPLAVLTTATIGSLSAPFLDVRFFWLALALGVAASAGPRPEIKHRTPHLITTAPRS